MGYALDTRLAFLRSSGVDPIDLSPYGDRGMRFSFSSRRFQMMESPNLSLPFFPDAGWAVSGVIINSRPAVETGAKDTIEQWRRFRADRHQPFLKKLVASLTAEAAARPQGKGKMESFALWTSPDESTLLGSFAWLPLAAETAGVAEGVKRSVGGVNAPPSQLLNRLIVYRTNAMGAGAKGDGTPAQRYARLLAMRTRAQQAAKRMEGIVLYLADRPVAEALPLLSELRPAL